MDSSEIVKKMTLAEKASLCSGRSFWFLQDIERLWLPPIMVTDGPHGLRKQDGNVDHLGIQESVPATCFPAACTIACSFDTDLLHEVGVAIAEECLQENVSVILGPSANIKRTPLCGRNFEYFSEDPYVTGVMATAWINGLQSMGIGASIKHFAANNQELWRMTSNSVVDDRALWEIYLLGFEMAVKQSKPWTVMCSYNLLNGTYASEHVWLLCKVLRNQWGFKGLVISDWGATDDRVEGVRAGMDIEMPYSGGFNDLSVEEAVRTGQLNITDLDNNARRVVELIQKSVASKREHYTYDADAHHELARKAAAQSCVLLKNENQLLPLRDGQKIAIIGEFAKLPRYQGAGSSKINPTKIDTAYDTLRLAGVDFEYADGYIANQPDLDNSALIEHACAAAKGKDVVLIFAGLPDIYESEGYDRANMDMPPSHNRLIEAVAAVNPNVVVILQNGAPVCMPWREQARAILLCYLGGQASGSGCADILTGRVCPSGKLAESWPLALADTPCYSYYPGTKISAEYRESIFVGYRHYEKTGKPVAYPFGHGISYTQFAYSNLRVDEQKHEAYFTLTNTGSCAGAEVAQLYIGLDQSALMRPKKELKAFRKVFLRPGESQEVSLRMGGRSFFYYNASAQGWAAEGGEYTIYIGASSADIRLTGSIRIEGDGQEKLLTYLQDKAPEYFDGNNAGANVCDASFTTLYGRELPPRYHSESEPFTRNSTINDIQRVRLGRFIYKIINKHASKIIGQNSDHIQNIMESMMFDVPLRSLSLYSQGALSPAMLDGIIDMLNGRFFYGLRAFVKGISKETILFVKTHFQRK